MADKEETGALQEQEWSHFLDTEKVDTRVIEMEISPPDTVKAVLCQRLNLSDIDELSAKLTIQRNELSKIVHIRGHISCDVQQYCVISSESVVEHIEDDFEAWYGDLNQTVSFTRARRDRMSRKEQNEQPMIEEEEDPEPIVDGKIDLGELVIQHLSLALNPYPRAEGVAYEHQEDPKEEAPEGTYDNPFAALKNWKAKETKE